MTITFEDIQRAARAIADKVPHTPFVRAATLSDLTGANVMLKLETLQTTNAFKVRGALNKLLSLTPEECKRGVIALSAGNHAQAVAYHATQLGITATIWKSITSVIFLMCPQRARYWRSPSKHVAQTMPTRSSPSCVNSRISRVFPGSALVSKVTDILIALLTIKAAHLTLTPKSVIVCTID